MSETDEYFDKWTAALRRIRELEAMLADLKAEGTIIKDAVLECSECHAYAPAWAWERRKEG